MSYVLWVTPIEKEWPLKISRWIPIKIKGMTLFSMIFYTIQAQEWVDFLSRSDINDIRPWTKSGQTPVLHIKFYWNTETLICLCIIYGCFHMAPKAIWLLLFGPLQKNFVYHPDLIEGLEIVLICYVHNIQTYSLFFSSVMFTLSVIQENEV